MQESSIAANESFRQQPVPAQNRLRRLIIVLLPVLTIAITIGSLFGLQWISQRAIELGYPMPEVQINGPSTRSLIRTQSYQFSSTATGRNLTYAWDFGDQSTANGPNVTHAYEQTGSFTVTLTATDPTGQSGTQTYTVTVVPSPPQASFTISTYSGRYVYFYAYNSTADPTTYISSYHWTFGDGSSDTTYYGSDSHNYSASGTYQVTLVVTDATGQSSAPYSQSVTVS